MTKDEMILFSPEKVEGSVCETVMPFEEEELKKLGEEMIKFCVDNGGLGLAAPQIGVNKRVIVWQSKPNYFQIGFNPVYFKDKKRINTVEGCLTYPGKHYHLDSVRGKKANAVYEVPGKDGKLAKVYKKVNNEEAIIFQHETDHVNGITIAMIGVLIDG